MLVNVTQDKLGREKGKKDYLSLRQASSRESQATGLERHVRVRRMMAASICAQ